VPSTFIDNYKGYIQTDGYSGYDALGRKNGIELVGCWAHARRKFMKVISAKSGKKKTGIADKASNTIRRLYAIEKQAREKQLAPDAIYRLRQEAAKPILTKFHAWLLIKSDTTPPKGLLGNAIQYTLKHWDRLMRYIDNGHLYAGSTWLNSVYTWPENSNPWVINGGTDKGSVPFVYSGNQNTHYVLEAQIPLNLLGLSAGYGDPVKQIKLHWSMACGNDYLNLTADVNPDLTRKFNPVPEPATLTLFGLGLLGLAGVRRKKVTKTQCHQVTGDN